MIDIPPTIPLETFREQMGYHPLWFWGMADNSEPLRPGRDQCRGVVKEYSWQDRDQAGRDDIRKAIARAERRLSEHLKYYPAPVYIEETVPWPRLGDKRMLRGGPYAADDRWLPIKLSTGWIQAVGIEARTLVSAGTSVSYLDDDNDGYVDTAVIGPITTSAVTDVKEVALYFSSNDRFGIDNAISEKWRIAPIVSSISGGQLTIRAPAWIFVQPKLYAGINPADIDPNASVSPYVTSVDIYRRYTKTDGILTTDSQSVIIWETRPYHGWWCQCSCGATEPFTGSPCDPAATARAAGRAGIRDAKQGYVTPAETVYNTDNGTFSSLNWWVCEEPDRVTVRYLAGYPLASDGQASALYREIVPIMAAAELAKPISGCAEANRLLYYWQQDLSKVGADKDLYATSADIMDNPFGTRRGHVYAWKKVVHLARGEGIRI